jgi:hypothetical protein
MTSSSAISVTLKVRGNLKIKIVGSQLVQLRSRSEIGNSQQRHEAVNMEIQGSTTLEAVIR